MKNILLLVHEDNGQEARVQAALDLARGLGGHLTCVDVTWSPPIVSNGFYDDAHAVAEIVTEESTREAANRVRLEARLAAEDVPWNWIDMSGDYALCLDRAAALADMIVVNRELTPAALPDMLRVASETIVRAHRPVLAVPGDCKRLGLESALVAWDGSRPCSVAAQAAVPILQLAKRVTLLEIEDGSVAVPAEEAASYLSRHAIHARVRRVKRHPGSTGDTLLGEARSKDYDYLVMGGFSHARWRESLFGGATRTMLKQSPIPVFYAH